MNLVRYLSQLAYFRNHSRSGRRACIFSLALQRSQLCAESVHIFEYYPRILALNVYVGTQARGLMLRWSASAV